MIAVRSLGTQSYLPIWKSMQEFTAKREASTEDELWLLEHPPVYTQGQAGKPEHILQPGDIPIVQSDRGGQVTYHGPGQLVVYTLLDIKRRHLGVRTLVSQLEQILISLLSTFSIEAHVKCGAPGVYVQNKKIASIGLRVRNGCTYHGLALNVNMDLKPFEQINPCGFQQLKMTHMADLAHDITMDTVQQHFIEVFFTSFDVDLKLTSCLIQGPMI